MRPNMMVGAICLISAASFAACRPSQSLDTAATDAEPLRFEAQPPAPKAAAARIAPKNAVAHAGATSPAVSNAVASPDATSGAESRTVAAKQHDDDAPIVTTIAGCLVLRDDGMFQLKDTDGQHAPKARSWKSGFVKKGSATVDVFDAGNRLHLGSQVNHRVSVSGTLTDREMRARSLRATPERCD